MMVVELWAQNHPQEQVVVNNSENAVMEGRKKNIWRALRSLGNNKVINVPRDNYPKGKAKYIRTEPDAAWDREHNGHYLSAPASLPKDHDSRI